MIQYTFEPQKHRAAAYDQGNRIGECVYEPDGNVWAIVHTWTSPDYRGQGVARQLVDLVVQQAGQAGAQILPVCSYAQRILG